MSGASWDDRKEGDWLASNGRWYPAKDRPKGWHMTALPPAPGHHRRSGIDLVNERAERIREIAESMAARTPAGSNTAPPSSSPDLGSASTPPATPSPRGPAASRGPARATVTSQRRYAARVEPGPPTPGAIDSSSVPPPAPRLGRDDAPPMPAPPVAAQPAPAPPAPPMARRPSSPSDTVDIVAGDFGRIISNAKKQIRDAINEAGDGTSSSL